jgi:RHS repeat-associated protein
LGRFINKDPIEEEGGFNLYAYCGNNGVNKWDYLGMDGDDLFVFSRS